MVLSHAEAARMKTAARVRCVCMDGSMEGWEKGEMPPDCLETETWEKLKFSEALWFSEKIRLARETECGNLEEIEKFCQMTGWVSGLLIKQQL